MTKDYIISLIKNNDPFLTFPKSKSSSTQVLQAWSNFNYVYFNNCKENFITCDNCKEILHHTSCNGTSSMTKHKAVTDNDEQRTVKASLVTITVQSIPRRILKKLTTARTECIVLEK